MVVASAPFGKRLGMNNGSGYRPVVPINSLICGWALGCATTLPLICGACAAFMGDKMPPLIGTENCTCGESATTVCTILGASVVSLFGFSSWTVSVGFGGWT